MLSIVYQTPFDLQVKPSQKRKSDVKIRNKNSNMVYRD